MLLAPEGKSMNGESIFARTNSVATTGMGRPFKHGRSWQYHSRSDRHSRVACWTVLWDLLQASPALRRQAKKGEIGFGINHTLYDAVGHKKKNLDLVIQTIDPIVVDVATTSFKELVLSYGIVLNQAEKAILAELPDLPMIEGDHGIVLLAMETKACMTSHGKAEPRLFDELNSSHALVHASQRIGPALSAGYAIINSAPTFVSPELNDRPKDKKLPDVVSVHKISAASKTAEHLSTLPIASKARKIGLDAMGISMVRCPNDGTPIKVENKLEVPEGFGYNHFISSLAGLYDKRFRDLSVLRPARSRSR